MRRIFAYLWICLLAAGLIAGCKKGAPPPSDGNYNPIYNIPIRFAVDGLQDIRLMQKDTADLLLHVKYISGTKQKVSVGVTGGMPSNVVVGFFPQIDTPDYYTVFRVITQNADTGTSVVTFEAVADTITESYSFKLQVLPSPADDAPALTGSYTETGSCNVRGTVTNQVYVSTVPGTINQVYIEGLWLDNSHFQVLGHLDPSGKTITIPSQTTNGMQFSGSGTYSDTEIHIVYQLQDGMLVNDFCTVVLTK